MVIDDDPYGMLRFAGDPLPTLRELGGGDPLVFAVRTFSKIIAPGLRVGWVDTTPELQQLLINAKQAMDTCTNLPAQRLLTGFLTGGHLEDHLRTQRAQYRQRKEAMQAALAEHFGDIARWTDPEGGFFCWITLDQRREHRGAVRAGAGRGRGVHPGHRVLAVRPVHRRAAAVLRLDRAGPHPRGRRPAPACRRQACQGQRLTPAEREVLARIDPASVAELTTELVRAPGENPPGEEAATVAALAEACAARGLEVGTSTVEPGRDNLVASIPGGDEAGLLLLGHTDVVPVGAGWTTDPYGGVLRDGRIYGRGATDMKGGLAACVVAMAALKSAGIELAGPVDLAALVDEEETGKGIRHFIEARAGASYTGCVVAEPTDLQTIVAARGDAYLEIRITGKAAHSGNPGGRRERHLRRGRGGGRDRAAGTTSSPPIRTRWSGRRPGVSAGSTAAPVRRSCPSAASSPPTGGCCPASPRKRCSPRHSATGSTWPAAASPSRYGCRWACPASRPRRTTRWSRWPTPP